jgi:exonuclease 1
MGIQGLLPSVKGHIRESNISEFAGRRVAIDGYAWLHKAVYGCAMDLCRGIETTKWITYVLKIIDMLLYHKIACIYMVFDGADLPAKADTEARRAENRITNLATAERLYAEGNKKEAMNYFGQSVDVSPLMAAKLIKVIKETRSESPIHVIVAPYEADAQLAFLSNENLIDAVIGEDSDTIPYGVKEMIFKLNNNTGECQHLILSNVIGINSINTKDSLDYTKFTPDMMLAMCVASGCDYIPSVKNIGLKKAYDLIRRQGNKPKIHSTTVTRGDSYNKNECVEKLLKVMRLDGVIPLTFVWSDAFLSGSLSIPANGANTTRTTLLEYELNFHKAIATFKHQVIYNPITRKYQYLKPIIVENLPLCLKSLLPQDVFQNTTSEYSITAIAQAMNFFGNPLEDPIVAQGVANGLLDPTTKEAFQLEPIVSSNIQYETSIGSKSSSSNNNDSNKGKNKKGYLTGASDAIRNKSSMSSSRSTYSITNHFKVTPQSASTNTVTAEDTGPEMNMNMNMNMNVDVDVDVNVKKKKKSKITSALFAKKTVPEVNINTSLSSVRQQLQAKARYNLSCMPSSPVVDEVESEEAGYGRIRIPIDQDIHNRGSGNDDTTVPTGTTADNTSPSSYQLGFSLSPPVKRYRDFPGDICVPSTSAGEESQSPKDYGFAQFAATSTSNSSSTSASVTGKRTSESQPHHSHQHQQYEQEQEQSNGGVMPPSKFQRFAVEVSNVRTGGDSSSYEYDSQIQVQGTEDGVGSFWDNPDEEDVDEKFFDADVNFGVGHTKSMSLSNPIVPLHGNSIASNSDASIFDTFKFRP